MKKLIEKLEKLKDLIQIENEVDVDSSIEVLTEAIQALQEKESDKKIDLAIKEFENLKEKATSLRDIMYLDGVLAVLDSIKALPTPPNK